MLNRTHLLTAACLFASAGLFVGTLAAADNVTVTNSSSSVTYSPGTSDPEISLPAGIESRQLNADKSIEKTLKETAGYALEKNSFNDLVDMLAQQDKERIKTSAGKDGLNNLDGNKNQRLNDVIGRLNDAWKSKYNQKFDMDYSKVLTTEFLNIRTGVVTDTDLLIDHWPVDPAVTAMNAGKLSPEDARIAREKLFGGQVKLEKGREIAIAHLHSGHGLPGIYASMIHETASGWKFDIPNGTNARTLYDDLSANLESIDQMQSRRPSDVNEAYRHVTHAVVAALYDINPSPNRSAANDLDGGAVRPANTADNR